MADQTNAEVSDERLRELDKVKEAHRFLAAASVASCECGAKSPDLRNHVEGCRYRNIASAMEAIEIDITRRSVTSQASEGETSLPRMDDIAAASIKYICADCAREESEYSCHSIEDVVIITDEVICLDHAKELHAGQQRRKAPDVAAKLRRQRMSIAAYQKAAENAPVSKRVERLETGWQTIETAPKPADKWSLDRVLVAFGPEDGNRVDIAYWVGSDDAPYWRSSLMEQVHGKRYMRQHQPTHWRPLIAPPQALGGRS